MLLGGQRCSNRQTNAIITQTGQQETLCCMKPQIRKKVLAEDINLEVMVKLGLANKQTQIKSDQMAGTSGESVYVRRVVHDLKEEVKRLTGVTAKPAERKVKCQTCRGSHKAENMCPSKKCEKCFDCGEKGHFKGAPAYKKLKRGSLKRRTQQKTGSQKGKKEESRRVENE